MIIVANGSAVTLTNQNQYYLINTNWSSSDNVNVTVTPSSGTMTAITTGEYQTSISLTTSVAGANHTYKFGVFRNGVLVPAHTAARQSNANVLFTVTVTGDVHLAANDVVDVRAECTDAAGQSLTITDSNFNLNLLH